jgi:hypothetical protein
MEKVKANPDYSASAVNLGDDPTVLGSLCAYQSLKEQAEQAKTAIDAAIPADLLAAHKAALDAMAVARADLIKCIDLYGSYQNTVTGSYAVKQRKASVDYKPELVRQYAPSKVASFVLVESVDRKAMEAMMKTGQLTPDQALLCGEVKETFAYIIQ